jgi:hypothetical protein
MPVAYLFCEYSIGIPIEFAILQRARTDLEFASVLFDYSTRIFQIGYYLSKASSQDAMDLLWVFSSFQ